MATGQTAPALQVHNAAEPVLLAMALGSSWVSQDDINDLKQQVVAKVLQELQGGKEIRDLDKYSKQVARNAFVDLYRKQHRERPGLQEAAPEDDDSFEGLVESLRAPLETPSSPSVEAIERDDARRHREMISSALGRLNPTERCVLLLRHRDGLDGAAIAQCLGYKSAGVVDTMAARARAKLERYLSPSLIDWAQGPGQERAR